MVELPKKTQRKTESNSRTLADGGYSSGGEALAYLHEKHQRYIPNFGQYKSEREGLCSTKKKTIINAQNPKGKRLNCFSKAKKDSKGYTKRTYRSSETDCKNCPLREPCCGQKHQVQKKLDDSIHKEHYDRMHQKLTQNANMPRKW